MYDTVFTSLNRLLYLNQNKMGVDYVVPMYHLSLSKFFMTFNKQDEIR